MLLPIRKLVRKRSDAHGTYHQGEQIEEDV